MSTDHSRIPARILGSTNPCICNLEITFHFLNMQYVLKYFICLSNLNTPHLTIQMTEGFTDAFSRTVGIKVLVFVSVFLKYNLGVPTVLLKIICYRGWRLSYTQQG